ncbi:MAG: hypothetical protein K1X70_04705 [Leptospirales bacterium]|nr:hypothetical protein [Leptospirales bacterium]HNL01588.1 hypothetical protein [Leptospiraceae bacterium]HNL67088.1 hypothetical protein [Leptospiraceae bacterium]
MKRCRLTLLLIALLMVASCKGKNAEPLLSSLLGMNSKTVLILKGTYASDSPLEFTELNNNNLYVDAEDTSVDLVGVPRYSQLPIYLDIGEIRLSSKDYGNGLWSIDTAKDAKAFWDVIASERQVYCSQPYSVSLENDTCFSTGGLINYQEFMNGRGALYPSRDVGPGVYLHAGIFVRAIATGHSKLAGAIQQTAFDNNVVINATNITSLVQYDPNLNDGLKQVLPPYWFPLHFNSIMGGVTANSMYMTNDYVTRVVEMRFNMKENMMVHGFTDTNGYRSIVAFSDWRRAHAQERDLGGNVLMRARVYYPDYVNTLVIQGGTKSNRHYYAIVDPVETYIEDNLPVAATPVRQGTNIIKNLMGGVNYIIQCRFDANNDGYPETILDQQTFGVLPGPGTVTIGCQCGGGVTLCH